MLLSHRYKFIYTKTAKTGGTSVESYFEKYCMKEGEWVFSHAREEYNSEYGIIGYRGENKADSKFFHHMSAATIRELVGLQTWNEYFKFCVIRNPYEKLISAFFHFHIKRNNIIATKDQHIDRFRRWIKTGSIINDRDKYVIDGKFCLDAYIKTENMLNDLERICNCIGVSYNPSELPRLKSGFTPPDVLLTDYFDRDADEKVKKNFAFEFENFGFTYLYD